MEKLLQRVREYILYVRKNKIYIIAFKAYIYIIKVIKI